MIFIILLRVALIVVLFYLITIVGALLYFEFGFFKKIYHDILRCHRPENYTNMTFDENFHTTCKFCHKKITNSGLGFTIANWKVEKDEKV